MDRRTYIKNSFLAGLSAVVPYPSFSKDLVVGHGNFRYKVDDTWGNLDRSKIPVNDCHEMVLDRQNRLILLTNHTKNNLIYYDLSGKAVSTAGTEYPGAHGLTLSQEGSEEFLYLTDTERHEVYKLGIDGQLIMTLPFPKSDFYTEKNAYTPTETAIAPNGDIYVADGYGSQHIIHYDSNGKLLNIFGGRGDADHQFQNAHGIAIDSRDGTPKLLVTARMKNQFVYFDLDGNYLSKTELPGAFICRPVIKGDNLYFATIWSGQGMPNSGMVTILNKDNQVVSVPGGNAPRYHDGQVEYLNQTLKLFKHPHDVCIDKDDNLYVCEWSAGQVYPTKLVRV